MRKTKIVCTLGPAVDSRRAIQELIRAGMNVARLNCSHGNWEEKRRWIQWIRELSPELAPVAILADLQGPKFRLGELKETVRTVKVGETLTVGPSNDVDLPIWQPEILKAMDPGGRLLLGDGEIELRLKTEQGGIFTARAISGGTVKSRQGVTLRDRHFESDPITDKDREDIREAAAAGVDFIALSYVKDAQDGHRLREIVSDFGTKIHLCAKIETREAMADIEEIAQVFDLIMVARGDMGLQMSIEEVPFAQKRIIAVCNRLGKPVITATQMLESMMKSPRPTRAEATDVANAILDGTDAVMLSGETAAGMYPFECVRTMDRIARRVEPIFDRSKVLEEYLDRSSKKANHTEAIAHAVCELADRLRPKAILTTSTSGQTARRVSRFRPSTPILCATWDPKTVCHLGVVWGVQALQVPQPSGYEENIDNALEAFVGQKRLKAGDQVIATSGVPIGVPGNTNLIQMVTA